MTLPEVRQQIVKVGLSPADALSVGEVQKFAAAEIRRWGKMIQLAGITE